MASCSGAACTRIKDSVATASDTSNTDSILSKLKSPQLSDLARKRTICTNPPPKGAKRSKGRNIGDPKSVSLSERLKKISRFSATSCFVLLAENPYPSRRV